MKSTVRIFIFVLILQFVVSMGRAQSDVPSIFKDPPVSPPPTTYSPTDSFDRIKSDVDRQTEEKMSPGPFVLYSDTNDSQPTTSVASPVAIDKRTTTPDVAALGEIASTLTNLVPLPSDRNALRKYLSIINPSAYQRDPGPSGTNEGFVNYFKKEVGANPCLQRRAIDFYAAVGRATKDIDVGIPALDKNLRAETHGKLSPGWLWKLALQSSGGDSGLALTLIGMCGHDDKNHDINGDVAFRFRDDSETARSVLVAKLSRYASIRSDLQAQTPKPTLASKSLIANIDQEVASLKKAQPLTSINCPANPSPFFLPESLGTGVDIDSSLKQEIDRSQNPDHLFEVPAKYYHVYAGAFLTCGLIETGMAPPLAKLVASTGARLYRGVYLCQVLSNNVVDNVPGYATPQAFLQSRDAEKKCRQKRFAQEHEAICRLTEEVSFYRQALQSPADLQKKIDGAVATSDASQLYRLWFLGGRTIAGHQIPCTDARIPGLGPGDLLADESGGHPSATGFNPRAIYKPFSWTNARYENAKRKLATWMNDSKWTVAQHEVGADFAAKMCHKRPDSESLEQAACRIDGQKNGHPSAPARNAR